MEAEHLEYFKAALEGRATVGWNAWFAANQQALSQQLSRPALLRLKFNQLDEAEHLLDEKGRPLPAIWRTEFGGAIGLLSDGEHETG